MNSFTIESWIYVRGYANNIHWTRLMDFGSGFGTNNIIFVLSKANGDGRPTVQMQHQTPLNQWIHFAFSYDGVTGRLYTNGVLNTSAPISPLPPGTRTQNYIGHNLGAPQGAKSEEKIL